jgi:hypothetical protein
MTEEHGYNITLQLFSEEHTVKIALLSTKPSLSHTIIAYGPDLTPEVDISALVLTISKSMLLVGKTAYVVA